jgi:hypothetical protein
MELSFFYPSLSQTYRLYITEVLSPGSSSQADIGYNLKEAKTQRIVSNKKMSLLPESICP